MIDHYRAQRMQDTVSSDILFCLIGSCISDFKARLVAVGRVGKFVHHLMQHEIYTHTHTVHFWFAPIAHLELSCPGSSKLNMDRLICVSMFSLL